MHDSLLLKRYGVLGQASAVGGTAPVKAPIRHLLFRGTQALFALERLNTARNEALGFACDVLSRQGIDTKARASFMFWSPDIIQCNDAICSLLNAIVLIQNCTPRALSYFTNTGDVWNSYHDVMKDLKKPVPTLQWPEGIVDLFTKYWESTGNGVRELRDLDQHYYRDLTDCRVLLDVSPRLILNYVKRDEQTIDILEYAPQALRATFDFVDACFQEVTDVAPQYLGPAPSLDLAVESELGDGLALLFVVDKNPESWMAVSRDGDTMRTQGHGVGLTSPTE